MNEDLSEIMGRFSEILKEKDIDLGKIINNNEENNNNISNNNDDSTNENDFNLDINTILKIKEILNTINKSKKSPRNTLLSALKPYLKEDKKEKLEQYMKIANLLSVLETFDTNYNIPFSQNNYDFVLILTLFLLIF